MHWRFGNEIRLSMLVMGLGGQTLCWSADNSISTTAAKTAPIDSTQVNSANGSSEIIPAGFSSAGEWHDTIVDNCENLPGQGVRKIPRRAMQQSRKNVGRIRGWFLYIRGHGPAIWETQ